MARSKPFRTVGRYDLLEVIGRGGAAVVYLAQQRDLRRLVALKELAPVHPGDTSFAARFVDESRVAGSLNHPNVVTVHEFFEADGVPLIAMEYLPRGSLRSYVGAITLAQLAGVLEGVLAGLAAGQHLGVVHRDLKPENLLVTADGRVKIADFGVARAYNQAITREVVTVAGTTIGTPAYMAPEQALGQRLTPATDLYSLGVVAWELLSGHVPFTDQDTPVAVLYRHVHEEVAPIDTVVPGIDPRLARWLAQMLAKRPEERFVDADAAWEVLEDVVLDLLGPRWRREAGLVIAPEGSPAPDATRGSDPTPASDPAPRRETVPVPVPGFERNPEPEADPALTVAPSRPPGARNPTIVRWARRHSRAEPEPAPASRGRRIGLAVGLAVVAIGAIVAVIVATAPGSKRPPAPARTPTVTTSQAVNSALLDLLGPLSSARGRGLSALSAARTPATQATAASAIATAYRSSVTGFARLPAAVRSSTLGAQVGPELSRAEQAWTALARAARTSNRAAYELASRQIAAAEQRLGAITRGL